MSVLQRMLSPHVFLEPLLPVPHQHAQYGTRHIQIHTHTADTGFTSGTKSLCEDYQSEVNASITL